MVYDCVIVGGGASGMCCAAALNVNKGLILEGGSRPGAKLLLTGGGRCNVTHSGSIKDFIPLYGDCGRKLRNILYSYNNLKLISDLENSGIPCFEEADGRVFPSSEKASDILNLLLSEARKNSWNLITDSELTRISLCTEESSTSHELIYILRCTASDGRIDEYRTRRIVIACGGITYPATGSDGSVFKILERDFGIEIVPPRSALAPITVAAYPYSELAGVSLDNVKTGLHEASGKCIACTHGSLLFTHRELSGPAIINMSRYIAKSAADKLVLRIDYSGCPALPKRFGRIRELTPVSSRKNPTHRIGESVDEFVVDSLSAGGMITVGGVSLDEINSKTMELKSHPGVYVIGEALDADGPTGGYNLQLCYSTARAAASAIASCLRP